jgi:hypothetical protein
LFTDYQSFDEINAYINQLAMFCTSRSNELQHFHKNPNDNNDLISKGGTVVEILEEDVEEGNTPVKVDNRGSTVVSKVLTGSIS